MNIDWSSLTLKEQLALGRKSKIPRAGGDGYTVRLVYESPNRKTGPIPVSMTDMQSCPPSCSLRSMGCYAEHGHVAMHWRRVARIGEPWPVFCARIAALPPGTSWRHNEAGDLPGYGDTLDIFPNLRNFGSDDYLPMLASSNRRLNEIDFRRRTMR